MQPTILGLIWGCSANFKTLQNLESYPTLHTLPYSKPYLTLTLPYPTYIVLFSKYALELTCLLRLKGDFHVFISIFQHFFAAKPSCDDTLSRFEMD